MTGYCQLPFTGHWKADIASVGLPASRYSQSGLLPGSGLAIQMRSDYARHGIARRLWECHGQAAM